MCATNWKRFLGIEICVDHLAQVVPQLTVQSYIWRTPCGAPVSSRVCEVGKLVLLEFRALGKNFKKNFEKFLHAAQARFLLVVRKSFEIGLSNWWNSSKCGQPNGGLSALILAVSDVEITWKKCQGQATADRDGVAKIQMLRNRFFGLFKKLQKIYKNYLSKFTNFAAHFRLKTSARKAR